MAWTLPPLPTNETLTRWLKRLVVLYLVLGAGWVAVWALTGVPTRTGGPTMQDYIAFWSASRLLLDGQGGAVYDLARLFEASLRAFPRNTVQYYWFYPPPSLLVFWICALLPYPLSWAIYAGGGALLLAWLARRIAGEPLAFWAALAAPAVAFNAWTGQTGSLAACALAASLMLLERRPYWGGTVGGLLAVKPQLAAALPFAWLARGKWAALLGAGLVAGAMAGLATLVFGPEIWLRWWETMRDYRAGMATGEIFPYLLMPSVYAGLRTLGLPPTPALVVHALTALAALAVLMATWRRAHAFEARAASLAFASLFVTPYLFYYDYPLTLVGLAYWLRLGRRDGFARGEFACLMAVWALPLWLGLGAFTGVPVPSMVLGFALWMLYTRERRSRTDA